MNFERPELLDKLAAGMRTVTLGAPAEQVFATVPRLAVSFETDPRLRRRPTHSC